jgi:hypothetical protein
LRDKRDPALKADNENRYFKKLLLAFLASITIDSPSFMIDLKVNLSV